VERGRQGRRTRIWKIVAPAHGVGAVVRRGGACRARASSHGAQALDIHRWAQAAVAAAAAAAAAADWLLLSSSVQVPVTRALVPLLTVPVEKDGGPERGGAPERRHAHASFVVPSG